MGAESLPQASDGFSRKIYVISIKTKTPEINPEFLVSEF